MRFLASVFSNRFASLTTSPIFTTIIAILFLAVSIFNFVIQEKETKYLHDEMHILTSQQGDINKEMQTLSCKLNSALQEIKDIKAERVHLDEKIEYAKEQINWIRSQLNDISEAQYLSEEGIRVVGILRNKVQELAFHTLVPYELSPQVEKGLPVYLPERTPEAEQTEDSPDGQDVNEHFQKAVFYQKNGELSKALQEYEGVLEIDTLNAGVHNNMGLIYQQMGEYDKALIAFRKAVSIKPDYNKARSNIGTVLYKQGHLDAAGMEFEFILEKEPENVHALTNLAIIYKEKDTLDKARDLLLKALNLNNTFPEAHYNLALILEELDSVDEAIIHYRAFLKYSHGAYTSLTADVLGHLEVIEKK